MSNIPNVFRKALDGFVLQPRSFFQSVTTAMMGGISLLDVENRKTFTKYLNDGIINEDVISQANSAPLMMMSLFHDLNSPLFKKYHFEPDQFLQGVAPAIENFHNISGALENELLKAQQLERKNKANAETKDDDNDNDKEEEKEVESGVTGEEEQFIYKLATSDYHLSTTKMTKNWVADVLNNDWSDVAKKNPDSLAGQLSRMITKELLQLHQLSVKTAFLLQNVGTLSFEEGSATVNNVALLSARACMEVEHRLDDVDKADVSKSFEPVDYNVDPNDIDDEATVAAQFEVLYDVTHTYTRRKISEAEKEENELVKILSTDPTKPPSEDDESGSEEKTLTATVVNVATIEGFLNGGPDGELRWRLALHRPAYEFPGMR